MGDRAPPEDTGRVVALAIAFFGTLALLGYVEGVFARLSTEDLLALAVFAALYAFATYALDPRVRAWVASRRRPATKAPAKSPVRRPAAT